MNRSFKRENDFGMPKHGEVVIRSITVDTVDIKRDGEWRMRAGDGWD